ncbi:hypothetical protein [Methylobacterium radiotolerans]|uniref:hypothetical protein n=1 Tax=Methylobacterium radiotolerans TaxID=31998 RepID=UPI000D5D1A82|nr:MULTISPECIES: hypothetical protein [Methylobacterium]MDE3749571.1 hypothetical protein [Methylobacterium radiotolerans]PVZ05947.1 hypothetical protein C7388_10335 [Methylobacterium organophilum]
MNETLKPLGRLCDACADSALIGPPPATEDPARHVGEIFRRLTLASETYPGAAFARIVAAVLVALGRACLLEAEAQARWLRERVEPDRPGIKVSATARRVDFDAWDPGDPE